MFTLPHEDRRCYPQCCDRSTSIQGEKFSKRRQEEEDERLVDSSEKPSTNQCDLFFSCVRDLQHFCFFLSVVCAVHVERLVIGVDQFPDGTMAHVAAARLRM
jgi:hypothetical protein